MEEKFSELRKFRESEKSPKYEFNIFSVICVFMALCYHYLVLMQEFVGSRLILFTKIFYKFCRFYGIHLEKTRIYPYFTQLCEILTIHAHLRL